MRRSLPFLAALALVAAPAVAADEGPVFLLFKAICGVTDGRADAVAKAALAAGFVAAGPVTVQDTGKVMKVFTKPNVMDQVQLEAGSTAGNLGLADSPTHVCTVIMPKGGGDPVAAASAWLGFGPAGSNAEQSIFLYRMGPNGPEMADISNQDRMQALGVSGDFRVLAVLRPKDYDVMVLTVIDKPRAP